MPSQATITDKECHHRQGILYQQQGIMRDSPSKKHLEITRTKVQLTALLNFSYKEHELFALPGSEKSSCTTG